MCNECLDELFNKVFVGPLKFESVDPPAEQLAFFDPDGPIAAGLTWKDLWDPDRSLFHGP